MDFPSSFMKIIVVMSYWLYCVEIQVHVLGMTRNLKFQN